jgi:hypothetical protein
MPEVQKTRNYAQELVTNVAGELREVVDRHPDLTPDQRSGARVGIAVGTFIVRLAVDAAADYAEGTD